MFQFLYLYMYVLIRFYSFLRNLQPQRILRRRWATCSDAEVVNKPDSVPLQWNCSASRLPNTNIINIKWNIEKKVVN